MNPPLEWPDRDEEERLLSLLRSDDPLGREAVAARFLPLLSSALARKLPHTGPELRDTAAADAVFNFLLRPARFDAKRCGLGAYLRMAAGRDLLNLLAKERRARRGIPLGSVEEPVDHRNPRRDDGLDWDHPILVAELAVMSPDERVAFELLRDGVRKTATIVMSLNLTHLSARQQVVTVRRLKDRLKRRLTRALGGVS